MNNHPFTSYLFDVTNINPSIIFLIYNTSIAINILIVKSALIGMVVISKFFAKVIEDKLRSQALTRIRPTKTWLG